MTGQILDYSVQTNTGFIAGDDGNRYTFTGADWQETGPPRAGTRVDFDTEGNAATAIYGEVAVNNATPTGDPVAPMPTAAAAAPDPALSQMGTELEVASPLPRIAAFVLDNLLLPVLTLGIGYLIWLVIVMSQGQTPGKQMMGLRVVRIDGSTAGWGLMFGRGFCKFLSSCIPFGYIISFVMMLMDDQRRAIHDRMVKTLLVRSR